MKQIHLSETKLNQLASEISNRLYESHYFNQDIITGEALNHFCDHEQINKFLLFQVYQVWQLQISRFKHSYFDFDQPEVNHLLGQLQNLLSRNISIKKEDFKPLLHKAVLNNLRLLTDPKAAFLQFFFQNQDKISVELYEKYSPFFSDFDFVINSILKYYNKNEIKHAEKDVFLLKFDRVLEVFNQKSEQSDDTYRSLRFLKLTDRRLDEVMQEDEGETKEREAQERAEEARRKEAELKSEAEAKREEEEARNKEVEAKRKEQASLLATKAKTEKSQKSFFDELSGEVDSLIELDEDDSNKAELKTPILDAFKPIETVKDAVKEEEPVWKKLQDQVDAPPTQAEVLKENHKDKKEDSLMDRLSKKEDKPKKAKKESKQEIEEVKPQEEPKKESVKEVIELAQENTKDVETILNKAQEEKDENAAPSVLEAAKNTDNKPSSLVDLLKAKEKENDKKVLEVEGKEESVKKDPTPKEEDSSSGSLLDRFRQQTTSASPSNPIVPGKSTESKTLVDKLKSQQKSSKSEKEKTASTPLEKAVKADEIPIHKQYRYVQKVFGGNNVRFRIIVDKINNAKSSKEVEEILDKYVFSNTDVSREDETVKEFVKLMRGQA